MDRRHLLGWLVGQGLPWESQYCYSTLNCLPEGTSNKKFFWRYETKIFECFFLKDSTLYFCKSEVQINFWQIKITGKMTRVCLKYEYKIRIKWGYIDALEGSNTGAISNWFSTSKQRWALSLHFVSLSFLSSTLHSSGELGTRKSSLCNLDLMVNGKSGYCTVCLDFAVVLLSMKNRP
jgi:hypothetical protein